jgi:phage gp16-like protein
MPDLPNEDQLSRYFSMLGKKGNKVRNARMSPEQRRELATKASKAAAKVRSEKAQERRRKTGSR